jgi:hypothetical protein
VDQGVGSEFKPQYQNKKIQGGARERLQGGTGHLWAPWVCSLSSLCTCIKFTKLYTSNTYSLLCQSYFKNKIPQANRIRRMRERKGEGKQERKWVTEREKREGKDKK